MFQIFWSICCWARNESLSVEVPGINPLSDRDEAKTDRTSGGWRDRQFMGEISTRRDGFTRLGRPAKRTLPRSALSDNSAAGLSVFAAITSLNTLDIWSTCHYIPTYEDSFGLAVVNIMDKTLVLFDNARRADYLRLLQWWQGLLLKLKQRRTARRDLEILSNFSDTELKDIGLTRNDLMSIEVGEMLRDSSRSRR